MVTLWMFHAGQTLVASPHTAPEEVWDDGLVAGFDAVSSTPSFWRYLFALRPPAELARAPLAQITLGGEPVRQDLLDRLAALFPAARLTHIYASTEVGAAIVVHDGREGFPARWLEEAAPPGRPALRVVDGVLHVRSPHAARGSAGADGWCATGDRVERRGHRAVVVGRAAGELGGDLLGDLLNVGGRKVAPAAVAGQLAASPLVAWCRVRGARAPLVGTLVAADVVLSPHGRELAPEAAERELTAFCAARGLPDWMVPRLWNWLERVPLTAAGKEERPAAERQAEVAPPIKAEVDA
jgi:acyl-CoA synthetase (AMP-forming)/AMP-acid ligase II